VGTNGGIQAGFRDAQAIDWLILHDVRSDNLVHVIGCNSAVPNGFWVDHHGRAVLTLVEAASLIGAHLTLESGFSQLSLKQFVQGCSDSRIAAPPWMVQRPLVAANKDVLLKARHDDNVQDSRSGRGHLRRWL